MNDLTQEQADRLAKWRWGKYADAFRCTSHPFNAAVSTGDRPDDAIYYGPPEDFAAAFRASMQSPMTNKDAELEAKLRWGMDAEAHPPTQSRRVYTVACGAKCGWGKTWEEAFAHADRNERGVLADPSTVRLEVIRPDLTPAEATAEAKRLWGDGYAFPAVGKAQLAVGCPGKAHGTGATFREALQRAESNRVFLALATAFGIVGCAAVRERNKREGARAIAQRPGEPHRKGCELAVLAIVEWCNARPTPKLLGHEWPGWFMIERYHCARRSGLTEASAYAAVRDGRCEAAPGFAALPIAAALHEPLRVMCAAYERGRGGYQAPVQRERRGGPVTYWGEE